MASIETFLRLGHKITKHAMHEGLSLGYRKFRAYFGTSPLVCVVTWEKLWSVRPKNSTPEHMLWALMLLKQYSVESCNATLAGVTEKTFRKWAHLFIDLLASMHVVNEIFYGFFQSWL